MARPRVDSEGQKDLDKAQQSFDNFQKQVTDFNPLDPSKPVEESEPQTKLSTREAKKMDADYIKPIRSISRSNHGEKVKTYWDEKNRVQRDEDWKYVKCIVENHEIIGESIEVWTAKWGCDPAHFWRVPVNKPVMIPKHLAEQLARCSYHTLKMDETVTTGQNQAGTMYGHMVVDHVKNRIDARPVGFGF